MKDDSLVTYRVSAIGSGYPVKAEPHQSMDIVWASQMCWFAPGQRVLIEDDKGNHKIFVREETSK